MNYNTREHNIVSTTDLMDLGKMLMLDYPKFVMMTAKPNRRQGGFEGLDDHTAKRVLAYTGLAGEAGEVAEYFKKFMLHGKKYDRDALKKEMGDVMWYMMLMCEIEGIPFGEVIHTNMTKLAERHLENPDHAEHHDFFRRLLGQS